jgi:hypothetical protein
MKIIKFLKTNLNNNKIKRKVMKYNQNIIIKKHPFLKDKKGVEDKIIEKLESKERLDHINEITTYYFNNLEQYTMDMSFFLIILKYYLKIQKINEAKYIFTKIGKKNQLIKKKGKNEIKKKQQVPME